MAIDNFAIQECTLEVCGDEVDTADGAVLAGGMTEKGTRGTVAQCRGEGLIEVDTMFESAPLHAEANLNLTVTLDLVYPNQFVDPPAARHVAARDEFP